MISNEQTKEILDAMVNKKVLAVPENIKDVVQVFKDQSLIHQLYSVYKDPRLKKYYLSATIVYENQNHMIDEIKRIFNENKIDFILLKGSVIRKIYPKHFLRLQGDVDVLVREKDIDLATKVLINEGYQQGHAWLHHIEFQKNNMIMELHHHLFKDPKQWNGYFVSPWEHTLKVENHEYRFDDTYFVMYEIAHLAKHFKGDGAGIRPFIDFYYIFNCNEVDFENIKKAANKIGLENFLNSIYNVIGYFFGFDKVKYQPINCLKDYVEIIIQSGTHGHSKNSNYYANRLAGKKQSKFKFYLTALFPSHEKMKLMYPYLNKYPILYPWARICRICRCIFVKSKDVSKIEKAQDDIERHKNVYDEIGLRS